MQYPDIEDTTDRHLSPLPIVSVDILQADAILLTTTKNFDYIGVLKDFFNSIYYPCFKHTEAILFVIYVQLDLDGIGFIPVIEKIIIDLKWEKVQETSLYYDNYCLEFFDQFEELGMSMVVDLEASIFSIHA